jgi:uncharacterized repeat protein (TIGR01451 family)
VAKTDASGHLLWLKQVGGNAIDMIQAISTDSSGNVYVTGFFSNTVDFDPGPGINSLTSFGGYDVFVWKLDSAGNFIWVKQIGGAGDEYVWAMEIDESDNIYFTGAFEMLADFDPGPGVFNLAAFAPGTSIDIFVEKMDANGNFNWAKQLPGSPGSSNNAYAISARSGMIYCTGTFSDTLDFDPGPGVYNLVADPGPTGTSAFVTKLDTSGNLIWARDIHGTGSTICEAHAIKADSHGNVLTSGYFYGTVDFDPGPGILSLTYSGQGDWDSYVNKLDASGNLVWNKRMEGVTHSSITLDKEDNIYTTGSFTSGTPDLDPNAGVYNLPCFMGSYISKLNYYGDFAWATCFSGAGLMYEGKIIVDSLDNIYLNGFYAGITDFDPDTSVFELPDAPMGATFFLKLYQDTCSSVAIAVDSLLSVSCADSGYISLHATGGEAPYTYVWNSTLLLNDSTLRPASWGIYDVAVTEARGCVRQRTMYIPGPGAGASFDLIANLVAGNFRPGFSSTIVVDAFNRNCDTVSGNLKLVLDNSLLYDSIVPSPSIISGDTLIWNFTALNYGFSHISPVIYTSVPASLQIGDTLCFLLWMGPIAGDVDSTNNVRSYCYPLINGFDPNDKQVYPAGTCAPHYVKMDQLLTYTVRFQNTGNASAINITVLDTLDPALDISSVRIAGSSHAVHTDIADGHILRFRFDGIHLPDSTSDEPGSHGYVIYEVMPSAASLPGTSIRNHADIYFDFNQPIITNTVFNTLMNGDPDTVVCAPAVGIAHINGDRSIKLYPNPTTGRAEVYCGEAMRITEVTVSDVSGRILSSEQNRQTDLISINIPGGPGLYFVTITDEKGLKTVVKVVKQ